MKVLKRNKRTFYYALFVKDKKELDEDGNPTGEVYSGYETPTKMKGSISANTGQTGIEQYGNFADYDKVIIVDDMSCPIDEETGIWIDEEVDETGENFDYVVRRRAESLNCISFAIQRKRT